MPIPIADNGGMGNVNDMPLANPRWEAYCRARATGKSQRQAMLEAYPSRESWSENALDVQASKLEANPKVNLRLEYLMKAAASAASITRAEVIDGMARTYREALGNRDERFAKPGAVAKLGATLLENLPAEASGDSDVPPADFGLMVAPPFLAPHRAVASDEGGEFWEFGGRFSGKSSHISLEVADGLRRHADRSAYVVMRHQKDMRDGVFEQMLWAFGMLGMDGWESTQQPLRLRNPSTGQVVIFRGCDDAGKTKAVKAPAGQFYAYQWFGEVDQLRGMDEVRTVQQSVTRGPGPFFRFYDFNPPRSRDSWSNREIADREGRGEPVYRSSYLDMPPEWVPDQVRADAEALRESDEKSYRHEWLGEPVGFGGLAFPDVDVSPIPDERIRTFDRLLCGQDFGWWPDPWAVTLSAWDPATRTLWTFAEDGGNKLQPPQQAERVKRLLTFADADGGEPYTHRLRVASDDADPGSIEAQRAEGVMAVPAQKGNLRLASYRWLESVHWVVDPRRCPNLAREARAKMHVQDRDGNFLEDIEDGDDHYIDATRYAVMDIVRRARRAWRPATNG